MLNEHVSQLLAASQNVYVTRVFPKLNADPGSCVVVRVGVSPESSVAVGCVQGTVAGAELISIVCVTSLRHVPAVTTGAVVSAEIKSIKEIVSIFSNKYFCLFSLFSFKQLATLLHRENPYTPFRGKKSLLVHN